MLKYLTMPMVLAFSQGAFAISPKITYLDSSNTLSSKTSTTETQLKSHAIKFLAAHNLKVSDTELTLIREVESLSGRHYSFGLTQNGFLVKGNEITLSTNKKNKIVRVFNSIEKRLVANEFTPLIAANQIYEAAWSFLQADNTLTFEPEFKTYYLEINDKLRLVHDVAMSVSKPYGHWNVLIDAQSGEFLSINEEVAPTKHLEHRKNTNLNTKTRNLSFSDALNDLRDRKSSELLSNTISMFAPAVGSGTVFNPNPNTALDSVTISQASPEIDFVGAYSQVELKNYSGATGSFTLGNTELVFKDFDLPRNTFVGSSDGNWNYTRDHKNNFLDTMTFYHLENSLSYLKSLGFTGSKKIFKRELTVDSNGANGNDNSYFNYNKNALSFGHGCVPDNEDADVILHELGHAIQINIASNSWYGGDTGAMGEGFGDYWAASYSYTTKNGQNFKPNWVFKWDGHNSCWGGRVLDKHNMKYKHSKTYRPHERLATGISDELWSTPVFQTFKELYDSGVSKETIDIIILESHFGLGPKLKMRDMAQVIVKTAKSLYPNENYFLVFEKNFKKNDIL